MQISTALKIDLCRDKMQLLHELNYFCRLPGALSK
jgi:hypothetical protein